MTRSRLVACFHFYFRAYVLSFGAYVLKPSLPPIGALFNLFMSNTQLCIPPGSPNRVPASAGVRAGMSSLPGGR